MARADPAGEDPYAIAPLKTTAKGLEVHLDDFLLGEYSDPYAVAASVRLAPAPPASPRRRDRRVPELACARYGADQGERISNSKGLLAYFSDYTRSLWVARHREGRRTTR